MEEDFLKPLVRYLRSDPRLQSLQSQVPAGLTSPILGPPPNTSATTPMWVFRGFNEKGAPFANVEGTGSSSITLAHTGYWGRKNRGSRLVFPEITVYYHCDVSRDLNINAPITQDARDKCLTLHKEITRLLHIIDKGVGGFLLVGADEDGTRPLKLVSSVAGRDVTIDSVPGGDGMVQGRATFEMEILL